MGVSTRFAITSLLVLGLACGRPSIEGPSAADATVTAEEFLADMEVGAWNAAFGRMHEDLRAECRSPERLAELVEAAGERPDSWTLREPRVRSHEALISGEVAPAGGGRAIVELTMIAVDDAWKIRFWSASNRELCREGGDP